jgi:hypothetical protein
VQIGVIEIAGAIVKTQRSGASMVGVRFSRIHVTRRDWSHRGAV